MINQVLTGMGLLSKLSERVTFVLIPPLVLIFLVLGTIFLGLATPTEGGAMGALGAFVMALARRKLELTPAQGRRWRTPPSSRSSCSSS
jgi:TRAP-type mannitol/chloroaromatic compound transport system permease large subunit